MYDYRFLDLKFKLINLFLIKSPHYVLDVSFSLKENNLDIQIVILENEVIDDDFKTKIRNELSNYEVDIFVVYISESIYNDGKDIWPPDNYSWFENVLLSKYTA